jgi:hypothetical protein
VHRAELVGIVERIERESFLALQQRGPMVRLDVALADDNDAAARAQLALVAPAPRETFQLAAAERPRHPVVRQHDQQDR